MRRVFLNKTKKSEDSDDKFRFENTLSLEGYQDWGVGRGGGGGGGGEEGGGGRRQLRVVFSLVYVTIAICNNLLYMML